MHTASRPFAALLACLMAWALPSFAYVEVGNDDQRLSVTGPEGNASYDALSPTIAYNYNDDRYLVCWTSDDPQVGEFEIFCDLLTAAGGVLADDVEISFFGPTGAGAVNFGTTAPALAHNTTDNEYLVCWAGDTDLDGQVDEEYEVFCRILDSNLGLGASFRVSAQGGLGDANDDAYQPTVAYNFRDNNYLVCWTGDQDIPFTLANDEFEIYCREVDANGTLGTIRLFSSAGGFNDPNYGAFHPRALYDSTLLTSDQFVVCWEADDNAGAMVSGESEIFCRTASGSTGEPISAEIRMSHQGSDGNPDHDAWSVTTAFDPLRSRLLVCWQGDTQDATHLNDEYEIYCGEWDRSLAATLPAVQISFAGGPLNQLREARWPTAVWNGSGWGVCWSDDGTAPDNGYEAACQILGPGLDRIGPLGTSVSSMGNDPNDGSRSALVPAMARNSRNGEWQVVWYGSDDGAGLVVGEYEVFGQRIDPARIFQDGFETGDTSSWAP